MLIWFEMTFSRIIILVSLLVFACSIFFGLGRGVVEEVEIRDYEGEDLSSINDFRENSILGPQYVDVKNYILVVQGLVDNQLEFNYSEVLDGFESFKKVVTLHCIEGWSVKLLWEGIRLEDLFDRVGVSSDASVVIFHAYDGYTTSLPLDYVLNNRLIMAYKMNNVTLPPERGFPFQLVAESKYGYKWIKWISNIELSTDEDFRGYYEARGYSNDAELSPLPTPTPTPTSTPTPSIGPTPTPTPSPSQSPTPSISPSPSPEPFPTTTAVVSVVIIAVIGIGIFVYLKKKRNLNPPTNKLQTK